MRAAQSENITESGMQVIEFNRANVVGASSGPNQVLDFFNFTLFRFPYFLEYY